jgi:hypothetical protein
MSRQNQAAARLGFQIFSTGHRVTTRDEINEELQSAELPISERMFDHYHRLGRHGVHEYMPINEFDISLKNGLLDRRSA